MRKEKLYVVYDEGATELKYAYNGDAGIDLYSQDDVTIHAGERVLINTGIRVAPENGDIVYLIVPKSGIATNTQLSVVNSPAIIDSNYRGNIMVCLENNSTPENADKSILISNKSTKTKLENGSMKLDNYQGSVTISKGEKIAQMVVSNFVISEIIEIDEKEYAKLETDRSDGGFGSSGV